MKVTLDMVQNDSDAYTYYRQFKHGEVEMDYNAQAHCEKVLTPEQLDEINYDLDSKKEDGRDDVKNIDKVDEHKDDKTTGNAAASGGAATAGGIGLMLLTSKAKQFADKSGWFGLLWGGLALVCGIATLVGSQTYDQAYDDRNTVRDGLDDNIQQLNDQSTLLVDNMNLMNEDSEEFDKTMDAHTVVANEQINEIAALQKEIETAEAMGDTARADAARKRLAQLQAGGGEVGDEDILNDLTGRIDGYRGQAAESEGMLDGCNDIKSFLKEGKPLGIFAKAESLFLTIAAAYCAVDIGASILGGIKSGSSFDFAGLAAGGIGAVLFGVALSLAAKSAKTFADKGKNELECSEKASDLDDPMSDLDEVTSQSFAYADETQAGYEEGNTNSTNSQNENQGNTENDVKHHEDNVRGGRGSGEDNK